MAPHWHSLLPRLVYVWLSLVREPGKPPWLNPYPSRSLAALCGSSSGNICPLYAPYPDCEAGSGASRLIHIAPLLLSRPQTIRYRLGHIDTETQIQPIPGIVH